MKSMQKSETTRLISPIAFSLKSASWSAYVSGKKRVQTASMRKSFLDLASCERAANSAALRVAG